MSTKTPLPGGGELVVTKSGGMNADATFTCTCGEPIILYMSKEWPDTYGYEWQIDHLEGEVYKQEFELNERHVFELLRELLHETNCKIEGVTHGI